MNLNYYFTFGQQYNGSNHPKYPNAHKDGWVRIIAQSEGIARNKAFELFGPAFGSSYPEDKFKKGYFPMGEIECFDVSHINPPDHDTQIQ